MDDWHEFDDDSGGGGGGTYSGFWCVVVEVK